MKDNRTTLINSVVTSASYLYVKQGVVVSDDEIKTAVERLIGDKEIYENEILVSNSVEVSVSIFVKGDSSLCRNLNIKFETHEYLITKSNWYLVPYNKIRNKNIDFSYDTYGVVFEYAGSKHEQGGKRYVIGTPSDTPDKDTLINSTNYGTHIISFEEQDVFVVSTTYSLDGISKRLIAVPYKGSEKIYDVHFRNMPSGVNAWKELHYPSKVIRSWYGRRKGKEATDDYPNAYIFTIFGAERRSYYRYDMYASITDGVEKIVRKKSTSFNPIEINKISACQD